jgi:ribonuclease HII
MAIVVGIDEAGFGPILGPMVVSSSVFSLPRELVKADLWRVLQKSVASKRKRQGGRLLVADSKKAYSKSVGIKHLQRTVLACLGCLGTRPCTTRELLGVVCPDLPGRMETYPWYRQAGSKPISADRPDIGIASTVFKKDLASNGMRLLDVSSVCLDVAYYNRLMSAVKNKGSVLFTAVATLIERAYDLLGQDGLTVIVDRQGGRVRYRQNLERMFGDMELKIVSESGTVSSYELSAGRRRMCVHFVVDADERFLPVSLASMVSKYVRELLVESINHYFAGLSPGLQPTAGYWRDGVRFIRDVTSNLPHVHYDSRQLIRCR